MEELPIKVAKLEDMETDHYKVIKVPDPEHPNTEIYAIMDKDNGVYNYYDNLLPRIYEALHHTEAKYVEMLSAMEVSVLSLVAYNETH